MRGAAIGFLLGILATSEVAAQAGKQREVQSGNYWQSLCQSTDALCTGFIAGLLDLHVTMVEQGRRPFWCAPDGVTYGQAVRIVAAYGEKNPAKLHMRYAELATAALAEAFPCRKKSN